MLPKMSKWKVLEDFLFPCYTKIFEDFLGKYRGFIKYCVFP